MLIVFFEGGPEPGTGGFELLSCVCARDCGTATKRTMRSLGQTGGITTSWIVCYYRPGVCFSRASPAAAGCARACGSVEGSFCFAYPGLTSWAIDMPPLRGSGKFGMPVLGARNEQTHICERRADA